LEEASAEEINLASHDLGSLEALVLHKLPLLANGLLQRLVNRGDNGYMGSSAQCDCSGSIKFVRHRSKGIHSLFRWITIKRPYYHYPGCRKTHSLHEKSTCKRQIYSPTSAGNAGGVFGLVLRPGVPA